MATTKAGPGAPAKKDAPAAPGEEGAPAPPAKKDAPRTMRDLRLATETRRRAAGPKGLENPLREGLRLERVPDPAAFVLFGATGDLAHRKVIPALFQLWRTHLLPHEFTLVAVGRRPYTDDTFRAELKDSLDKYSRVQPVDPETWERPRRAGSSTTAATSRTRRCSRGWPTELDKLDEERGTRGNRIFYLATQPSPFAEIVAGLGRVGLDHERHDGGWRRVVIEKPFGHDLDSAIRLNREVGKVFRERQVYRIDHYLGKETVRNLLVFRFGNGIFEPIWNRRHIDHVQITVAESIGIEGRGAFYEETGAIARLPPEPPPPAAQPRRDGAARDVRRRRPARREGQGHPRDPGAHAGRRSRATWCAASTARAGSSAKPVIGYRKEEDVDPQSETETYVAARLAIDDWRWSGVPFYLRMGKRLPKRATEIAIQFKEVPHRLFRDSATDPEANLLAMRIQPDEGIMLRFGAKVPGLGVDVRNVTMDFTYGSAFQIDSPDAYETLILDALLGDASLFTRADEVEEAWSIVDPIIERLGGDAGARLPQLRGRHLGPRGRRRPARARGPAVAADLSGAAA